MLKKSKLILSLVLALMLVVAAGCGLSEEAFEQMTAELEAEGLEDTELVEEQTVEAPAPEVDSEAEVVPFGGFATLDVGGNTVDDSIFYDYDLTMVNVWATFCGPCIEEMPDLGELNTEYGDNFQIVGLVFDTLASDGSISDQQVELANQIIEQTGANYTHLLPSIDLNWLMESVAGVPTTLFVNGRGEIVGQTVLGSRSKAEWTATIDSLMTVAEGSAQTEQVAAADNTATAAQPETDDWEELVLPVGAVPLFPDCCE